MIIQFLQHGIFQVQNIFLNWKEFQSITLYGVVITIILFFHPEELYGTSVTIKVAFQIVKLLQPIFIIASEFSDLCGTECYRVKVLQKAK